MTENLVHSRLHSQFDKATWARIALHSHEQEHGCWGRPCPEKADLYKKYATAAK